MALIKCPECGREVSNFAKSCPGCGYPIEEMFTSGVVRIKMPNNVATGWVGLFSSRKANIFADGKLLWSGQHGENASFTIDKPTTIRIDLGSWANEVTGTVSPKRKYSVVEKVMNEGTHKALQLICQP